MLEQLEKFACRLSNLLEWVGFVAIMLMVMITCIDVLGAKLFQKPFFAAIDLVMLAQLVAIPFATAATLLIGKHIKVEFLVMLFPKRMRRVVDIAVHSLSLALFVVIVWRLTVYGYHLQMSGELSSTARIPLHFFAYGASLACMPVCMILLLNLARSIKAVSD